MKSPIRIAIVLCMAASLSQAQPLVNLGLVGVGRGPTASFDQLGPNVDTLGGTFSAMTLDLSTLQKSGDTFTATLYGLPDRGFGDGATDYHPRLQTYAFSVTPYYGPYPAPAQNQIGFNNTATLLFTVAGSLFTGFNPDDTNILTHPQSPADSPGAGKWSLDSEGIARKSDGSFYVSDEYGPFVYYFNPAGQLQSVLPVPTAYVPKVGPAYPRMNLFGTLPQISTNDSGRYFNRGLEGLSLTPNQKKLVTVLQSPLQQDGENRNPSRNTRILLYDVDPASPSYHTMIGEYIFVLTLNAAEALNRHTPISEIFALSDTKFLLIERDSRGRGGDAGPILYKRVVVADVSAASNLVGTGYDLEKGAPGQISLPRATLPTNIVAAARGDLVDLIDTKQLAKFGFNVKTNWDDNTVCEKWEGLAVLPLNDPAAPNDYLLLVGNDNDFKAPLVYHNGVVVGTNDVTIDNLMFAFRIGEDHIAPTLTTCPGTLRVAAGAGCSLPNITGSVSGSDNSAPPLKFVQSPVAGTVVPLETPTNVTVRAVDAAGNQSDPCIIAVTVFDGPPTIKCPGARTNSVGANCVTAIPDLRTDVTASDNCGGVVITQDPPGGTLVGPGTYSIVVTATDTAGQAAQCTTAFTVRDTNAPVIIGVTPSAATLWPPNHQMVPVSVAVDAVDNCSVVSTEIISVTSSEPVTGDSDTTSPDWEITGPLTVNLRAERLDSGPGRVYTITVRCVDGAGNTSTRSAQVTVPHDQRTKNKAEL